MFYHYKLVMVKYKYECPKCKRYKTNRKADYNKHINRKFDCQIRYYGSKQNKQNKCPYCKNIYSRCDYIPKHITKCLKAPKNIVKNNKNANIVVGNGNKNNNNTNVIRNMRGYCF